MHVIGTTATALAVATALATFAVPAEVQAKVQAGAQARSVSVSYSDLDLSSPAGVRALDGRIKRAVRTICGTQPSQIVYRYSWRHCANEAMRSTEPQLALAMLKARREAYAMANMA